MSPVFGLLERQDEQAFAEAFAIYRDQIEPSEQKTKAELRALLGRLDYRFVLAREGDEVTAFALAFVPPRRQFVLIEYVAVRADRQGSGLGSEMFALLIDMLGRDRITLLEVDDAGGDDPSSQRSRRLAFYHRLGCRVLEGVAYQLPLRNFGEPPPMVLLAHAPEHVEAIPRRRLERWLRCIYVDVYGQAADDSRIAAMSAGEREDVRLVGIGAGASVG
jgi:hypothetical protein